MATFSPTDAALEGFRILRERRRAMLIWAVVNLVFSAALGLLLIVLFGPVLVELEAVRGLPPDSPKVIAAMEKASPMYALMIPLGLAVIAVFSAAVYRIVLRPQDNRYGYLRIGRDEGRLVLLTLIYFVLAVAFTFAVTLAATVLAEGAGALGEAGAGLVSGLLTLGAIGLMVFVAVRMSLAGPMTFAEGRLRVFESWRLTRGVFWRLLGAYVVAIILMIIVFLLALIIYVAVATIVSGGNLASAGELVEPNPTSIASFLSPVMGLWLVFVAVLSVVQNAVLYAPTAVAYRQLAGAA